MARDNLYPKDKCKHCGKMTATWGAGRTLHAKKCRGLADELRQLRRVFSAAFALSGKGKRKKGTNG